MVFAGVYLYLTHLDAKKLESDSSTTYISEPEEYMEFPVILTLQ
jgi:hypothetical protein